MKKSELQRQDAVEEGLELQSALPGYGKPGRKADRTRQERESAGDWTSITEFTDIGPFGWFVGVVAGLAGWFAFGRRKKRQ